jgi:hypothetical protein
MRDQLALMILKRFRPSCIEMPKPMETVQTFGPQIAGRLDKERRAIARRHFATG